MEAEKLLRPRFSNRSCKTIAVPSSQPLSAFVAIVLGVSLSSLGHNLRGQELKLPALEAQRSIPSNTVSSATIDTVSNPLLEMTTQAVDHSNETLGQLLSESLREGNPRISQTPKPTALKPAKFLPSTDLPPLDTKQIQFEPTEVEIIPTSSLSLSDLESLAFEHNPTLAAAKARLTVTRGQQIQAGLYPNPMIGYQGMEMGVRGTAGQQGGFIGQRFITGGKLKLDQAAAGKQVTATHFEFHAQELRVLSDVRIRFYDAVTLQQRVKLTNELVRIGDELVRATE